MVGILLLLHFLAGVGDAAFLAIDLNVELLAVTVHAA
jgi:hypothetical protein